MAVMSDMADGSTQFVIHPEGLVVPVRSTARPSVCLSLFGHRGERRG